MFTSKKLDWTNKQYIQNLEFSTLRKHVQKFVTPELFEKIDSEKTMRTLTERLGNFQELQVARAMRYF